MSTTEQFPTEPNAQEAEPAPVVAVERISKSFGTQAVLNGISLAVNRGETLAVLGRSGSGKSVLLRLIIGLEPPDSGRYAFTDKTSPACLSTDSMQSE